MWIKIKTWVKKNLPWLAVTVGALVGFLVGRRTVGTSADFDKLREDNTELVRQIGLLREQYASLVNLNRLNEQQLEQLAGQLEVAERLVGQAESIDTGNAGDIEKLSETNKELGDWIRKYGEAIRDL